MSTGTFVRRSGAWVPLTKQTGMVALPTGPGIYTYPFVLTQAGVTDLQSALNWVKTQSGGTTLTLPAGTYPLIPSFTQAGNTACIMVPAGISVYGQGPAYTVFTLSGALTLTTAIPTTSGQTNSNYIFRTSGSATKSLTLSNFSIDGSGIATSAVPSFQGTYSSTMTYASGDLVVKGAPSSIYRSLIANNTGNTPVGGGSDANWEYLTFGGLAVVGELSPTLSNLLIKGIYGYANTPPGEIFSINLYRATGTVTVSDIEIDGGGVGAALIGCNSNAVDCTYVFNRTFTHNSGHSHGVAMYQCMNATFNDCISIDNGTGTGGSGGIGFNHEECYGTITHNNSRANHGNTLASSRFEAGNNVSSTNPNAGADNSNYYLNGVTFTNSLYSMKIQGANQTSIPQYDAASILRGSKPTNSATQTAYPLPGMYVGS